MTISEVTRKSMPIARALPGLQILRREDDRPPHVRRRARVESESFLRLLEVASHDVGELLELDLHGRIERVEIVDGHEARRHVPLVVLRVAVRLLDVRLRLVLMPEQLRV